jgi:hypothetical protein
MRVGRKWERNDDGSKKYEKEKEYGRQKADDKGREGTKDQK